MYIAKHIVFPSANIRMTHTVERPFLICHEHEHCQHETIEVNELLQMSHFHTNESL